MEMHVILTLAAPGPRGGMGHFTATRTITVDPAVTTRADLLTWMVGECPESFQRGANILFFSAEPNALPVTLRAVKG